MGDSDEQRAVNTISALLLAALLIGAVIGVAGMWAYTNVTITVETPQ